MIMRNFRGKHDMAGIHKLAETGGYKNKRHTYTDNGSLSMWSLYKKE